MNRSVLVVAALLLVGALAWLTQSIHKSGSSDDDAPPPAAKTTPESKTPATPTAGSSSSTDLPAEIVLGDPKMANRTLQVGWTYDAQMQSDPGAASAAISALRKLAEQGQGHIAVVVVNLDLPAEDRSPAAQAVTQEGLAMNGHLVSGGTLGQGDLSADSITQKAMSPGGPPTAAP